MSLRPKLAGLVAAFVTCAALLCPACSSSSPQDMNKGTDVGLFFEPPDSAPDLPPEVASEVASEAASETASEVASATAVVDGAAADSRASGETASLDGGTSDGAVVIDAPQGVSVDGEL